jgi:hypothetical protein
MRPDRDKLTPEEVKWAKYCGATIDERKANLRLIWLPDRTWWRISCGHISTKENIEMVRKHLEKFGTIFKADMEEGKAPPLSPLPRPKYRAPARQLPPTRFLRNTRQLPCRNPDCRKEHRYLCQQCHSGRDCCICDVPCRKDAEGWCGWSRCPLTADKDCFLKKEGK